MKTRTQWVENLLYNLKAMQENEPRGIRKLTLHDAHETIEFLCEMLDAEKAKKSGPVL